MVFVSILIICSYCDEQWWKATCMLSSLFVCFQFLLRLGFYYTYYIHFHDLFRNIITDYFYGFYKPFILLLFQKSNKHKIYLPGVSIILILWSFQSVYVAADWIVMPRCLSSSIESIVAPTLSFPFTCGIHEQWKFKWHSYSESLKLYKLHETVKFNVILHAFQQFSQYKIRFVLWVLFSQNQCVLRFLCCEYIPRLCALHI